MYYQFIWPSKQKERISLSINDSMKTFGELTVFSHSLILPTSMLEGYSVYLTPLAIASTKSSSIASNISISLIDGGVVLFHFEASLQ